MPPPGAVSVRTRVRARRSVIWAPEPPPPVAAGPPSTIDAMERDILSQPESFRRFRPPRSLPEARQRGAVFCGSGDSLASCMLAEAHSGHRARAADPHELAELPRPAAGDVYVVSVSGRTEAGVAAARAARRAVAVTSDARSRLAGACGSVIPLRFENSDAVTAGTSSFLDSALTCMSLVGAFPGGAGAGAAGSAFSRAGSEAEGLARLLARRRPVTFLGSAHTYPLAMYAAAKMHEVLGAPARYERTEQFSHMGLFSASPGDAVVVLDGRRTAYNSRLAAALADAGLAAVFPDPGPAGRAPGVRQALFYAFVAQLVPLALARKEGRRDCHFVASKRLLRASDGMIYVPAGARRRKAGRGAAAGRPPRRIGGPRA